MEKIINVFTKIVCSSAMFQAPHALHGDYSLTGGQTPNNEALCEKESTRDKEPERNISTWTRGSGWSSKTERDRDRVTVRHAGRKRQRDRDREKQRHREKEDSDAWGI